MLLDKSCSRLASLKLIDLKRVKAQASVCTIFPDGGVVWKFFFFLF